MRFSLSSYALGLAALLLVFSQDLSAQPFDQLSAAIESGQFGNLNAVLISQDGEIIYEDYFRGSDADDIHQVQSITKSVGSALIGIAHRQGKIRLDQNLAFFFGGDYPMSGGAYQSKSAITVEQVLQQRHGIEWDESGYDYRHALNPVNRMIMSNDWYQFVLTRPMDAEPGQKFNYSSGASTLMSRMIRVATGHGPAEFAMQELFTPLGITRVHWELYSEEGLGHGRTDWPPPDQDVSLGFGLWLRARDLVKIGELYLNGGVYNGRRILDQSWIDASWIKYSNSANSEFFPAPGWGHGYQWWVARIEDARSRSWDVFFASGWGSQVIFIIPELDLVMVTAGNNQDYNGPDVDALLVSLLPELDPVLDERFNAAWYDPLNDGQGLTLEIQPDGKTVVGYWYTYDYAGNQRWFILLGELVDGVAQVTIFETSGGIFLQADPYRLEEWGTGRFRTVDCHHMRFEFESDEISTTLPLTRLTGACYEAPR
jgi:CubicO group peptidase (beta-lactamase class C family)